MKLTKKRLQILIKEELSLLETNIDVDPKTGQEWSTKSLTSDQAKKEKRPSAYSPMTGQEHFGTLPSDDDDATQQTDDGSIPIESDQEANKDGDAYWVMVDDLVTSIGRQRATRVEGSDDEVYIRTGQAEGITVKVVRRGQ
jgi:hypothetical protein